MCSLLGQGEMYIKSSLPRPWRSHAGEKATGGCGNAMPGAKTEELKEINRVLRRLSPRNVERLRNYAVHLELEEIEEEEPALTLEEEECVSIATAEIAEGKGRLFNEVLKELW